MKRIAQGSICALAAAALLELGPSVTPALANTYTLNLSAPKTAVVGRPILIKASGVNPPPSEYWASSWMEIVTIPTSVLTSCPATGEDGTGVATQTGGQILAIALRPNLDSQGNFSNTIGYTPPAPGGILVCGYSDDGAGLTLARASLTLNVQGPPANVQRPSVSRSRRKLACSPGRWSGNATRYSYGWLVGNKTKRGATGRKLRVTRAVRGRKVRCSVTASNSAGAARAVSRSLRVR